MALTGRETNIAFAKFGAGSWGVAASVTRGIYFQSTGGLRLQPTRVNDRAMGQAFLRAGDLGDVTAPDLTWNGRSRYDDHSFVIDALAMGSPAAATISTSASGQTTSYQHVIDLAESIDGLGLTGAIDKVFFVDELTSAKVFGFAEQVGDGGVMDKSYRLLGSKPTDISSVNTRSTVNGASFVALTNRIFRHQGTFRINVQSGGALGASDALTLENLSVTFERPQDAPHVFSQDYIHEPADNDFPTVSIRGTLPRMASSTQSFYAALRTNAVWKADLTYLGTYINSTDQYQRLFEFPHVEVDEFMNDVNEATQVKPEIVMTAKLAASSPTGMPFVNPFRLTLINTHDTEAF